MWDYVAQWFEECCRYVKLFNSFYCNHFQSLTLVFKNWLLKRTSENYLLTIISVYFDTWVYEAINHKISNLQSNWEIFFIHSTGWKISHLPSVVIQFLYCREDSYFVLFESASMPQNILTLVNKTLHGHFGF